MADTWYNGYNPRERNAKFKLLKQRIRTGQSPPAAGPCALCGDPEVAVEYHDEDYGQPFLWEPPALLALCRHCHRDKLHKRFERPARWQAYVAHVRRGGYARDLKDPAIKKELQLFTAALQRGETYALAPRRPYTRTVGREWFAHLRMDLGSLSDAKARPRP